MAKLSKDPISVGDLEDFVQNDSDFSFEMKVLAQLRSDNFSCLHSGTYSDPVTGKVRQFDIRAYKDQGDAILGLAVECKNFRDNNPLLLSTLPRTPDEAFHNFFLRHLGSVEHSTVEQTRASPLYRPGEPVSKKMNQIGRDEKSQIVSDDSATFEKLNQAVNSCADIVEELGTRSGEPIKRMVVPILVIPNGMLWQVDYSSDGTTLAGPHQITRSSQLMNHSWQATGYYGTKLTYRISHVEIVTFDALRDFSSRFFDSL